MKTMFTNGMIVDGSGDKPYKGCLVIEGDKILFVGEKTDIKADRVIDVNGAIRNTTIEVVGEELRMHMSAMKPIL